MRYSYDFKIWRICLKLPTFYTKKDWTQKVCLTYFITILYDETDLDIQVIIFYVCLIEKLSETYWNEP